MAEKKLPAPPKKQDSTPTPKPVSTAPEVKAEKPKEEGELVQIVIDRNMTDGGIRVNGKLYVGTVRVSEEQAKDLLRIQEEYWETKQKMYDPSISVRMKSDFQKEQLFLADPKENEGKKGWTRDYGLLPEREWLLCAPEFQKHLLELRKAFYGY